MQQRKISKTKNWLFEKTKLRVLSIKKKMKSQVYITRNDKGDIMTDAIDIKNKDY